VKISTILFDADGVIQRPTSERRSMWAELLGGRDDCVEAFLKDVFAAERACYVGTGDFGSAFRDLFVHWKCSGNLGDAFNAWTAIEVDREVLEIIASLRRSGYRCHLASNQEPSRAAYMSEVLGYRTAFDREFYSCALGYAKPSHTYFKAILDDLGLPNASQVLFLDDVAANVNAAKAAGLHASLFAPAERRGWSGAMRDLLATHGLTL
jgi:putative hydrolase of the HAD superfamily